jgi:hypothetical protein
VDVPPVDLGANALHTLREGLRAAALLDGLADRKTMTADLLQALAPHYELCGEQAARYRERAAEMRAQAQLWRERVWRLWITAESLQQARGRSGPQRWPIDLYETSAGRPHL